MYPCAVTKSELHVKNRCWMILIIRHLTSVEIINIQQIYQLLLYETSDENKLLTCCKFILQRWERLQGFLLQCIACY